jgi:glycosyl transferase family 2
VTARLALLLLSVSSVLLFLYGANLIHLTARSFRTRRRPTPPPRDLATVVVQLPIFNERFVVDRVIDAAASLDWPAERLEVQVLDDSDDVTADIAAASVARWRARGVRISHVRRADRSGYKAGALAHGLNLSGADFVAIFDADFVPPPHFLRQTMGAFDDPRVGFVQARWSHLNERAGWLTRAQALFIDFHFLVEQPVRAAGFFTNFTGTAGVWRRRAIEEAGGWSAATLTEDLDLSYRAQLAGWRAAYVQGTTVPQELPTTVNAYRRQQARWATGSFQCALRLLGRVLLSSEPAGRKLQAAIHLCSYGVGPLMLLQVACYPLLITTGAAQHGQVNPLLLLNVMSVVPIIALSTAQARRGSAWWMPAAALTCQLVGAGLSLTCLAALGSAFRPGGEFRRTPKYRADGGRPAGSCVYRTADTFFLYELAAGLACALLTLFSLAHGEWLMGFYAALIGGGLLVFGTASMCEGIGLWRLRLRVEVA